MKCGFVIYYEFVDHCCLTLENHTCVVTCDDQHYCAYCINMARTPPGLEEKGILVYLGAIWSSMCSCKVGRETVKCKL